MLGRGQDGDRESEAELDVVAPVTGLTHEDRLLLLSARVLLDDCTRHELEAVLRRPLDWESVVERAVRHGTAPLLHAHLAGIEEAACVPPRARARLADLSRLTWARNTVLVERCAEIVGALERAGVPSIGLKGVVLAPTVYPDLALRPMTDVDLLIRPDDRAAATAALRDAGYRTAGDDVEAVQSFDGFRLFARDSTLLDLHWALTYSSVRTAGIVRVDHDGLWRRARRPGPNGVPCWTLSPEDTLLHLAFHLTIGSDFARLIWFSDIDALVRKVTLDWDRVCEEAGRWRVRAILGYVLGVLRDAFATPVPAGAWARLRPGRVRRAAVGACIGLAAPPGLREDAGASRVYLAEALLMDRVRDVARVLWRSLVPAAAWTRLHYGISSDAELLFYRLVVHPARVVYLAVRRVR